MVFSCIPLANAVFHQTGKRRQDIDRRVDGLSVKRAVKYNLALGDISGQIGDRMGDIVVGHGEDRKLCHRTVYSLYDTRAFIDSGELTVQISGITFTAGDLSFGGGYLTHCLCKGSHIRQDDENVHILFECKIFRHSERYFWCDQTLYYRIVCKIQKHCHMICDSALFKCIAEEVCDVVLYTHSCEHDSEFLIRILSKRCLLNDLRGKLVMRKTVS